MTQEFSFPIGKEVKTLESLPPPLFIPSCLHNLRTHSTTSTCLSLLTKEHTFYQSGLLRVIYSKNSVFLLVVRRVCVSADHEQTREREAGGCWSAWRSCWSVTSWRSRKMRAGRHGVGTRSWMPPEEEVDKRRAGGPKCGHPSPMPPQ